jgi:hypothetical protein
VGGSRGIYGAHGARQPLGRLSQVIVPGPQPGRVRAHCDADTAPANERSDAYAETAGEHLQHIIAQRKTVTFHVTWIMYEMKRA